MAINLNLSVSKGLRLAIGLSSLLIATFSVSNSCAHSTEPLQSSTLISDDVDDVPENAARNSPHVPPAPLPVPIAEQIQPTLSRALAIAAIPSGPNAHTMGTFGSPHNWPIMPIAMMLMPDGTVLAYGTDKEGKQDTQQYAVWNTTIAPDWNPGTQTSTAFKLLANNTKSNIFCSAQVHLSSKRALIIGGDVDNIFDNATNAGNNNVVVFESQNGTTEPRIRIETAKMPRPRWYPTAVTLPNRDTLVLGGQLTPKDNNGTPTTADDVLATYPASTPDIRANTGMWTTLSNAGDTLGDSAYGSSDTDKNSWFYPRAWVDPSGKVFILTHSGKMFNLDTGGDGTLRQYSTKVTTASSPKLSSVMFAPGKILSIRNGRVAMVVNINGTPVTEPVVTKIAPLYKDRAYGSLTVLADGKVWANGGTSNPAQDPKNDGQSTAELDATNLDSEIWDPNSATWKTDPWKATAQALYARHYHSSALLLPDGSVMTAGGGAPGPQTNLNGEIYYPPYLFNSSNNPATRPTIQSIKNDAGVLTNHIRWNQEMTVTAGTGNKINRITLVRAGAATHTFNNETRFFDLDISQGEDTNVVKVSTPKNAKEAPPGYYMVFAWNVQGVPSVSKIIEISY